MIRFWEKEFEIKPKRSCGGQRFYTQRDFDVFKEIKRLLYEKGFTIAGARSQLFSKKVSDNNVPGNVSGYIGAKAASPVKGFSGSEKIKDLLPSLEELKQNLIALQNALGK